MVQVLYIQYIHNNIYVYIFGFICSEDRSCVTIFYNEKPFTPCCNNSTYNSRHYAKCLSLSTEEKDVGCELRNEESSRRYRDNLAYRRPGVPPQRFFGVDK